MTEPRIPRYTPFWTKQADLSKAAIEEVFQCPHVQTLWTDLYQMIRDIRGREDLPDPALEEKFADVELQRLFVGLRLLALIMCEQSPALAHGFGLHLPVWLLAVLLHAATGDLWPLTWQQFQSHFLPDNLVTMLPDGNVAGEGLRAATPEHWRQLHEYFTSLRPPRPGEDGGRPPDMEEESFKQNCWDAYQKLLDQKRRDGGRIPYKTEVAAEMLINPKTLTRNLARYHLPWPPLPPR